MEAHVAEGAVPEELAVDPDVGVIHHAIEGDGDALSFVLLRDVEALAIPTGAMKGESAGAGVVFYIKRTLDRPVVRKGDITPLGIIEASDFCAFGLGIEELPSFVEGDSGVEREGEKQEY